jgi:hypothetical protein
MVEGWGPGHLHLRLSQMRQTLLNSEILFFFFIVITWINNVTLCPSRKLKIKTIINRKVNLNKFQDITKQASWDIPWSVLLNKLRWLIIHWLLVPDRLQVDRQRRDSISTPIWPNSRDGDFFDSHHWRRQGRLQHRPSNEFHVFQTQLNTWF